MTRVVNIRRESYDVYIGRPSKWGNPYTHLPLEVTMAKYKVDSVEDAINQYRNSIVKNRELLQAILNGELDNKVLGCHCYPKPCHGDILAELANNLEIVRHLINSIGVSAIAMVMGDK